MKAGHAIDTSGIDFDDAMGVTVYQVKLLTLRQAARQRRNKKKRKRRKQKAK